MIQVDALLRHFAGQTYLQIEALLDPHSILNPGKVLG